MRMLVILPLLLAAPLPAQHAPEACKSISDANLPLAFAGWAAAGMEVVAADGATAAYPTIEVAVPATVRLHPHGRVRLNQPPAQARAPDDAHAGMVMVAVPAAGQWRVSASTPVWIDVIAPGGPVQSAAHGRMAPCTSIRKVVAFDLQPGRHMIQLSGNPGRTLKLMVSRAP